MVVVDVHKIDDVWMRIDTDMGVIQELSDHFTFFPPGYKWSPKYKTILPNGRRLWDGKIRLMKKGGILPLGLLSYVIKFCKSTGYEIRLDDELYPTKISISQLDDFISDTPLCGSSGDKIQLFDHQYYAIKECIKYDRRTIVSSTSSGKSLIIYMLIRWYLQEMIDSDNKILIIVPTKALVHQMAGDFSDYSLKDPDFDQDELCHLILEGAPKTTNKPIIISTWQSIFKEPISFFNQFGTIVGDEAHHYKADAIKRILNKSKNARYRFGMTGTLTADGSVLNKMVIEGGFGRAIVVATNREMIDKQVSVDIDITMLKIEYDAQDKAAASHMDYNQEIVFLSSHNKRNQVVVKCAGAMTGNTLVLFHRIKHGKLLMDLAQKAFPEKEIYLIYGANSTQERESIRKIAEINDGVLIFASLGIFSTGVNIKRLHNVILGSPFKSLIKVLQSIGRGLRKHKTKNKLRLVDVIDDMTPLNGKPNYSMIHGQERMKIYINEKFDYKNKGVKL